MFLYVFYFIIIILMDVMVKIFMVGNLKKKKKNGLSWCLILYLFVISFFVVIGFVMLLL